MIAPLALSSNPTAARSVPTIYVAVSDDVVVTP
jgi:hypothetical protein